MKVFALFDSAEPHDVMSLIGSPSLSRGRNCVLHKNNLRGRFETNIGIYCGIINYRVAFASSPLGTCYYLCYNPHTDKQPHLTQISGAPSEAERVTLEPQVIRRDKNDIHSELKGFHWKTSELSVTLHWGDV